MTISKQTAGYLQQLLATGLYGATVEDVMERLICRQIEQLIKDRVLQLPAAAELSGPRCPHCGSPKLNNISGMGQTSEYQCLDCNQQFTL